MGAFRILCDSGVIHIISNPWYLYDFGQLSEPLSFPEPRVSTGTGAMSTEESMWTPVSRPCDWAQIHSQVELGKYLRMTVRTGQNNWYETTNLMSLRFQRAALWCELSLVWPLFSWQMKQVCCVISRVKEHFTSVWDDLDGSIAWRPPFPTPHPAAPPAPRLS